MARRPHAAAPLAEPDELDRLVEVETRLEERLRAAREEGRRRLAAAEEAARAAEAALDGELEPALAACREQASGRLAEEHARLRRAAAERSAALDALDGAPFERLVDGVLGRLRSDAP